MRKTSSSSPRSCWSRCNRARWPNRRRSSTAASSRRRHDAVHVRQGHDAGVSACTGGCMSNWPAAVASPTDKPSGDWTLIPGGRQTAMGIQGPSAVSLRGGQAGGGCKGRRLQGHVAHGKAVKRQRPLLVHRNRNGSDARISAGVDVEENALNSSLSSSDSAGCSRSGSGLAALAHGRYLAG